MASPAEYNREGVYVRMENNKNNENKKPITEPMEMLEKLSKGEMELIEPFEHNGETVSVLKYDFKKITGIEMCEALDSDPKSSVLRKFSNRQLISLFGMAVEHVSGINHIDVTEKMAGCDALKGVQLAEVFFLASTQAASRRITNR